MANNNFCRTIPLSKTTKFIVDNREKTVPTAKKEIPLIVTNCISNDSLYAAIYTHSIARAVHGKAVAKASRTDRSLIGNIIDSHVQDMRHGQTHGIPQGSVIMDFIAELVLGYADLELGERPKVAAIAEYRILRYHDDYRIFAQNPQMGDAILKAPTELLIELGLKLTTSKTTGSSLVVTHSLKADKRAWLRSRQGDRNLQKHLIVTHSHGNDFPNAGSLSDTRLIRAGSGRFQIHSALEAWPGFSRYTSGASGRFMPHQADLQHDPTNRPGILSNFALQDLEQKL